MGGERYPGSLVADHLKQQWQSYRAKRASKPRGSAMTRFEQLVVAWEGVVLVGIVGYALLRFSVDAFLSGRALEFERRKELVERHGQELASCKTNLEHIKGSLQFWHDVQQIITQRTERWQLQHQVELLKLQLAGKPVHGLVQAELVHSHASEHYTSTPPANQAAPAQEPTPGTPSLQQAWRRLSGALNSTTLIPASTQQHHTSTSPDTSLQGQQRPLAAQPAMDAVGVGLESGVRLEQECLQNQQEGEVGRQAAGHPPHQVSRDDVMQPHTVSSAPSTWAHLKHLLTHALLRAPITSASARELHADSSTQQCSGLHGDGEHVTSLQAGAITGQPGRSAAAVATKGPVQPGQAVGQGGSGSGSGDRDQDAAGADHTVNDKVAQGGLIDQQEGKWQERLANVPVCERPAVWSSQTTAHWVAMSGACSSQIQRLLDEYDAQLRELFEIQTAYERWKRYTGRDLAFEAALPGWPRHRVGTCASEASQPAAGDGAGERRASRGSAVMFRVWLPAWDALDAEEAELNEHSTWDAVFGTA